MTSNSLIIGRHGMCELYLSGDPRISLRHLTLLLYPKSHGFRFRLLDLRSSLSFQNERGDLCKSVEADGPLFIRLGSYTLFFFPTKSDIFRRSNPRKAWDSIPRRLYDEQMFLPPTSPDNEDDEISSVFSLPPPRAITSCSLGDIVAEMELDCKSKKVVVSVDQASLETGILLGRYGRCDSVASGILNVNYISRVHLLLIMIAGEIYVIDTGSTNGCYYRDKRFTRLQMDNNREITLGKSGKSPFYLRWKQV